MRRGRRIMCGGDCDVPPSIQAERHPTWQPAAGARGQIAQAGQQANGQAAVGEAAVTTVSAVTAVTAATAVTTGSGAAVSSLERLVQNVGQTRST